MRGGSQVILRQWLQWTDSGEGRHRIFWWSAETIVTKPIMAKSSYMMQSLALDNGEHRFMDLPLEFEGRRAFVIWDAARLGGCIVKARLEINAKLLQRIDRCGCDFFYCGWLHLPRPQDN